MTAALLEVENLSVHFETRAGVVRAVDGVSFEVQPGETLALVGESGCGKSVTAMSILRLIESQRGKVVGGSIRFGGRDLLRLSQPEMQRVRGNDISMIFQEPMTSLNPVYTVGYQIAESLRLHRGLDANTARREVLRLLDLVDMPAREQRIDEYPHQLSGGMRQRVMIAMALACDPKLLIADEPTTALDVTIQAQILDLLRQLQSRLGMSILLITHDLGVVASMAQRVVVMYAGRIAESSGVVDLFDHPRHPYSVGLLHSLPDLESEAKELQPIEGNVPDALAFPPGCRFHPRCPFRFDPCDREIPPWVPRGSGPTTHGTACHFVQQHPDADLVQLFEARVPLSSTTDAESPAVPQDHP